VLGHIKNKLSAKKISAFFLLLGLVIVSLSAPLSAQSVTQGYSADKVLQRGTLVSLDAEDTSKVVATNRENQDRLHGVVVSANDSPFTLSDQNQKTFVATVGRFDALVSTESGVIQPGDFLTVSNITGIAMKAGENDLFTVGKAIEGFNGEENQVSTTEIRDSAGNVNKIAIGRVLIDVSVGSNPLLKPAESNLPGFLQKATEAIAGKPVSAVRVYIGAFILLAAASIAGSLLYSGIKSSVISIGRNPLSKKSITKSLMQIILTSIIIFLIGLFGVYLLLRL
jgi:multisubunit Na+/H+ antiporter MnhB subunit